MAAAQYDKNDLRPAGNVFFDRRTCLTRLVATTTFEPIAISRLSSAISQDRLSVITVEPLLFRGKDGCFRDSVRAHTRIACCDLGGIVHLVELLFAAGNPLHPGGARVPKLHVTIEGCDRPPRAPPQR